MSSKLYADTAKRLGAWTFVEPGGAYGTFAYAELDEGLPYRVRVSIGDDDRPVEWGDCEPTEAERANARAFYVAVQVLDADDTELYHDGIGGVDVIDLPGYDQRDWEDAAAYAAAVYLLGPAVRFARLEDSERVHWAARDVETVDW